MVVTSAALDEGVPAKRRREHTAPRDDSHPPSSQSARRVVDATFVAGPGAAAAARSAIANGLTGQADARLLADAELVVSELVTNSVQHAGLGAGDVVRVGAVAGARVLRLEVGNRGCRGTIAARKPDLGRGDGYGLYLVDALAHSWGVSRDADTVIWVEFRF